MQLILVLIITCHFFARAKCITCKCCNAAIKIVSSATFSKCFDLFVGFISSLILYFTYSWNNNWNNNNLYFELIESKMSEEDTWKLFFSENPKPSNFEEHTALLRDSYLE